MRDPYTWNGTEPVTLQDWNYYHMFVKACRERSWMAGFGEFPYCTPPFGQGTVAAIADTTVEVDPVAFGLDVEIENIIHAINGEPLDPPDAIIPTAWAVIINAFDYENPHRILRGKLTHYDRDTGVFSVEWNNPWRLRWGPESLAQFLGTPAVLIPSSASQWPWWHERLAERPSDFPTFSGNALARGPFPVTGVYQDEQGLWFAMAGHTFRAGDLLQVAGGPLAGSTPTVAAVRRRGTIEEIRLAAPGLWEEPYPTGWSCRHVADRWPFEMNWGATKGILDEEGNLLRDLDLVVAGQRWRLTALSADCARVTVRLEEGEAELPLYNAKSYGAVIPAAAFWSEISRHDAFRAYSGIHEPTATVLPNPANPYRGVLGQMMTPQYSLTVGEGDNQVTYPLKDNDIWAPWRPEDGVEDPQICLHKDVTKSLRFLQMYLAGAAYSFVPRPSHYDAPAEVYGDQRNIPNYGIRCFVDAGISGSKEELAVEWEYDAYHASWRYQVTASCDKPAWYEPWMGPVQYVVVCSTWSEKIIKSGLVGLGEDGRFHFDFDALYDFIDPASNQVVFFDKSYTPVDAYAVYLTPGFRRYLPAAIRYFYAKTCLLPAIGQDEFGHEIVIEPEDDPEKCGGFYKRLRSETYEGGQPFAEGHLARYVGDSKYDPPTMLNGNSIDKDYRAKWYVGHPAEWENPHRESGAITGGDTHYIQDSTKDWFIEGQRFQHGAIAAGGSTTSFHAYLRTQVADKDVGATFTVHVRTQTGSFLMGETVTQEHTGGVGKIMGGFGSMFFVQLLSGYFQSETPTTLNQRTITGLTSGATAEPESGADIGDDGLTSHSAFWSAPDMLGNPRFLDFVAEITLMDEEGLIIGIYYRPISGHDLATTTISWTQPLPYPVHKGDLIRIREPLYELNRWQERLVQITLPACDLPKLNAEGEAIEGEFVHWDAYATTAQVTHNDRVRLFVDTALPDFTQEVDGRTYPRDLTGATYQIIEYLPGDVWLRKQGKWVRPTAVENPRGLPYPNLAPTTLLQYGYITKWDYVARPGTWTIWDQMRRLLNLFTWTEVDGGFSPNPTAAHEGVTVIEHPMQVAGYPWPYTMTVATEGNGQLGAAYLMANYPALEDIGGPPEYQVDRVTSDGAYVITGIGFDQTAENHDGCAFRDMGAADPYGYGVVRMQIGREYDRAGGYPHVNAVGRVDLLTAGVEFFVFTALGSAPFMPTETNPNYAQYNPYLNGQYELTPVAGGASGAHVHAGVLILPPVEQPEINLSKMPTQCLGDAPVPAGYPFDPWATRSWSGAVKTIWKWNVTYGPPAATP